MKRGQTFVEGLSNILMNNKAITREEADSFKKLFKETSKASFDDFLLEQGLVSEQALLKALSEYFKVSSFDAEGYFFDHYLITKFPKDFLIRNEIVPLEVEDNNILIVVASNPIDEELSAKIGQFVSWDVLFMVGLRQEILNAISEYYDKPIEVTDPYEYLPEEFLDEEKERIVAEEIIEGEED